MRKKILYVSALCSDKMLTSIFRSSLKKPGLAVQKFHRLIVEGFAMQNELCSISTLSIIPVIYSSHRKRFWKTFSERVDSVFYNYVPIINFPIIKSIISTIYSVFFIIFWEIRSDRKEKIIICDVLSFSLTVATLVASKIIKTKVVGIVTDLPSFMGSNFNIQENDFKSLLYKKVMSFMLPKFDAYILLTEQMNKIVNLHEKPYMVMEGLVDFKMNKSQNTLKGKSSEKILIYAGGIYKKYGVEKLIKAFMKLNDLDLRLYIYGIGNLEKDMPFYCSQDSRITYFGVVSNNIVVKEQLKATLLINPRPTNHEFTTYSFPSKNMEYMVSGTPIVTTSLAGMPKEYYDYVYIFEDESLDGIYKTLKDLLSKPKSELHEFGGIAKNFVLTKKSNLVQANRLINFLKLVN